MTPSTIIAAVGDWSHRIARTVMFTMFGIVPVHVFVPCEASATTAEIALGLLFITGVLSIFARKFSPFGGALIAMILHGMSMH